MRTIQTDNLGTGILHYPGVSYPADFDSYRRRQNSFSSERLIRTVDILVALIILLIIAPLMLCVAAAVFLTDRGPILYRHERIGAGGKTFPCLKFRTMVSDAEQRIAQLLARDPVARAEWARDQKLRNDPRITPIGKFLRRSSMDELPQLWNVIVGDMSIVGPRPIVRAERERYGRYFRDYCSVRPGITGLWQVSGRNDVNYRRRVAYDVLYARACSFRIYAAILARTIPAVLLQRGSY